MKRKPVWIQWHDACSVGDGGWMDELPSDTSIVCNTVGILLRKTKDHLVIAHTVDPEGRIIGAFSIPRTNVVSVHTLSE